MLVECTRLVTGCRKRQSDRASYVRVPTCRSSLTGCLCLEQRLELRLSLLTCKRRAVLLLLAVATVSALPRAPILIILVQMMQSHHIDLRALSTVKCSKNPRSNENCHLLQTFIPVSEQTSRTQKSRAGKKPSFRGNQP